MAKMMSNSKRFIQNDSYLVIPAQAGIQSDDSIPIAARFRPSPE
jgi:hypothetical protein